MSDLGARICGDLRGVEALKSGIGGVRHYLTVPLKLITGPANSGKAALVLEAIRTEAARGNELWLVLPTAADVRHYRGELAEAGVVLGVRVTRFGGLLAELARRAGLAEAPLEERARERLLAALTLESGGARRGFAPELGRLVAELEALHLGPEDLRAALESWAGGARRLPVGLRSLADTYERYHGLLGELGRTDPELRAARALDTLRERPLLWGSTPVLFYGFDDLTPQQEDAIQTLSLIVQAPVTVALSHEPGRVAFGARARAFQTLLPWAQEHRALEPLAEHYAPGSRTALFHLERTLFEPVGDGARGGVDPGDGVRLLEGQSERGELELVAAEVRALLQGGLRPSEIALVHRTPDTVREALAEVFVGQGIPLAHEPGARFAATSLGGGLLALLRCALLDGDERDLLRWLRTPGLVRNAALLDRFERTLRCRGIRGLAAARELWEGEHWPLSALERLRACAVAEPAALCACLERELWGMFDRPRHGGGTPLGTGETREAEALAGVLPALAGLRELIESLAARHPEIAAALGSAAALSAALEDLRVGGDGGAPLDTEAVALLGPLALRARRVRALFLCGLQEGLFPRPPRAPAYLDDEERRSLAERSGLILRHGEDALGGERYLFYACLSRPEEHLFLSWHGADDDGNSTPRSLFVDDVCDLFCERLFEERRRVPAPVATGPAQTAGVGAPASTGPSPGAPLGELRDGELLRELAEDHLWSASSLEAWACCPVRWFVERMLRPEQIEPDSEAQTEGSVIHEVLRAVHERLRAETGSARLGPERLGRACELMREALREECAGVTLAHSPELSAGIRRRLEAELARYLEHAAATVSDLEPRHLELEFGFPGDSGEGLPAFELADGVRVRGRIDRVDVGSRDRALVFDYKRRSRASLPGAKWARSRNLQVAVYMRAVQDLLGYEVLGGLYQPVTGDELRARGAISEDVGLATVRTDRFGAEALEDLVQEAIDLARAAGREASAGRLQARPETCSFGRWGCRFPGICRCEHGAG